jgi:geranylgeranyl pyrophosphate synthase
MRIVELIKNGSFELGASAFEEFKLIRNFNITPEQYLKIVRMKAADVESYTKIGAIIGCDDEQKISAFGELGRLIGMVAILRDDIEDTFDDKFELRSRILNESLPLPIVFSLSSPKLVPALQSFYSSLSDDALDKILEIVEESKGFEKTKEVTEDLISQIRKILGKSELGKKIASLFN